MEDRYALFRIVLWRRSVLRLQIGFGRRRILRARGRRPRDQHAIIIVRSTWSHRRPRTVIAFRPDRISGKFISLSPQRQGAVPPRPALVDDGGSAIRRRLSRGDDQRGTRAIVGER